jgi:hypothetical protein
MDRISYSYLSPKCQVVEAPEKGGHAVRAVAPVRAGEVVAVWSGGILTTAELAALPEEYREHSVQVEEGLFLTSFVPDDPADFINHSCDPNAGMSGQIVLVAMRAIAEGEEITFDYAMTDGDPYDEFACACQGPLCRGRVTGDDWRLPELWRRYAGYFSPYLQRRIDGLRQELGARDG